MKYLLCLLFAVSTVSSTTHVHKREDDLSLASLANQVGMMAAQMTSLTAEVTAMKNQVTSHQASLDKMVQNVAFYCDAGAGNPGISVSPGGTLIFKYVFTNVGNAYDKDTGFFLAPVAGLYQFHVTFMAYPDAPKYLHASLQVDGATVATTITDSRHNYYDNVGIHPLVHVRAGGKVHVVNSDTTQSVYYPGSYTTFSGFLLRAD